MKSYTSQPTKNSRARTAWTWGGIVLTLILPSIFLAPPAVAQSSVDPATVSELWRNVVMLQTGVLRSDNQEIRTESQSLLNQVRALMSVIEANEPPAHDDTTSSNDAAPGSTDTPESASDAQNAPALGVRENGVTVCPDLDMTKSELQSYLEDAHALEPQSLIRTYDPSTTPGVACLGAAILNQCETAIAHHVKGYTLYVTSGTSAYNDPVLGRERCYIGLSERDRPDRATTCSLLSIANRDREREESINGLNTDLMSITEANWFLKVTLPEFINDHILPLEDRRAHLDGGDQENHTTVYSDRNPVQDLASRMECTQRAIDLDGEEMQ